MRIRIGRYLLNRKLKKKNHTPVICNLENAKHIGIIYNAMSAKDMEAAKKIEKFYLSKNINVETLGFSNSKVLNETLISDQRHYYIGLKDYNWVFQPKSDMLKDFISKKFDILVDLYTLDDFCIEYIVKTSESKFLVGAAHINPQMHDFMIDCGNRKDDVTYLGEQINHYLSVFK
ncbi:DUF6913 domain-containing protein [Plebeiibacterium marinum]|uniref:Uncharacterized protein n=1 Tax=Plebeiibacterium marinum TaxID=2992111 RepID=A0AAE3MGU6_9BACT|nr:hypothetical protein [Plebeiobacterium marinum]MCW3807241.1 hypothetical protein [Plebeiobacterium marinum]